METTEHELDISTHDLARRSTVPHDPETGLLIISTHDLTRRSTFMLAGVYSAEYVFQLTTSRRGRLVQL